MAVDMFLKLDGIKGESADDKHKEEIDLMSFSWGAQNHGSAHVASGAGAGKVSVHDITVTKYIDKSSPILFQKCAAGDHIKNGAVTIRKAGGTPVEYFVLNFETALITSVATGGAGGEDRLTESVTLNFSKVKLQYQEQDATGKPKGGPVFGGWDIAANKKY